MLCDGVCTWQCVNAWCELTRMHAQVHSKTRHRKKGTQMNKCMHAHMHQHTHLHANMHAWKKKYTSSSNLLPFLLKKGSKQKLLKIYVEFKRFTKYGMGLCWKCLVLWRSCEKLPPFLRSLPWMDFLEGGIKCLVLSLSTKPEANFLSCKEVSPQESRASLYKLWLIPINYNWYLIDFHLNTDVPSQFCVFYHKIT